MVQVPGPQVVQEYDFLHNSDEMSGPWSVEGSQRVVSPRKITQYFRGTYLQWCSALQVKGQTGGVAVLVVWAFDHVFFEWYKRSLTPEEKTALLIDRAVNDR